MSLVNTIVGAKVGSFEHHKQHLLQLAPQKTNKDIVLEKLISGHEICSKKEKHIRAYAQDFVKAGMPIERLNCNELGCEHTQKHGCYYFEWADA